MPQKILLVEDDARMLEVMRRYLENRGYGVIFTNNGAEALIMVRDSRPDLVVTDVRVPGLDGFELCRAVKRSPATASVPVIIISGECTEESDVVAGYEKGADDYLPKPFAFAVLAAKIAAVLRRYSSVSGPSARKLKQAGIVLDPGAREARVGGKPVTLTRKEFDLLALLLEKKGRVLGVPFLLETIWGYDMATYDNPHTVETHVSSLRRKLGQKMAARLVSVTGFGYKFE